MVFLSNKKRERIKSSFWIWLQFDNLSQSICRELQIKTQKIIKSPKFENHLTISGPSSNIDLSVIKGLNNLVTKLKPFPIFIESYSFKEEYFEAFFLKVKKNKNLLNLKREIDSIFQSKDLSNGFFPHVSLAYANVTKEEKKECIKMMPKVPKSLMVNKVTLIYADENKERWEQLMKFNILEKDS